MCLSDRPQLFIPALLLGEPIIALSGPNFRNEVVECGIGPEDLAPMLLQGGCNFSSIRRNMATLDSNGRFGVAVGGDRGGESTQTVFLTTMILILRKSVPGDLQLLNAVHNGRIGRS